MEQCLQSILQLHPLKQIILKPPKPREVHLWCVFPEELRHQSTLLRSYVAFLSQEERAHLSLQTSKSEEYLLTRTLARSLLSRYAGGVIEPNSLIFEKNEYGKPQVVWPSHTSSGQLWLPPKINFNLSHTQSLIACAITTDTPIGIDVEDKNRKTHTDLLRFARRRFSKMESICLEKIDNAEDQKDFFLKLWTLKESYGKALGKGISGTMLRDAAFEFQLASLASQFLEIVIGAKMHDKVDLIKPKFVDSFPTEWQFLLLQIKDTHYASLCVTKTKSLSNAGSHGVEPLRLKVIKAIPHIKDQDLADVMIVGVSA